MWILDAVGKRKGGDSGQDHFAQRVADEIIAIVEGRSAVWERRAQIHKTAITNRTNLPPGVKQRPPF